MFPSCPSCCCCCCCYNNYYFFFQFSNIIFQFFLIITIHTWYPAQLGRLGPRTGMMAAAAFVTEEALRLEMKIAWHARAIPMSARLRGRLFPAKSWLDGMRRWSQNANKIHLQEYLWEYLRKFHIIPSPSINKKTSLSIGLLQIWFGANYLRNQLHLQMIQHDSATPRCYHRSSHVNAPQGPVIRPQQGIQMRKKNAETLKQINETNQATPGHQLPSSINQHQSAPLRLVYKLKICVKHVF